MNMLMSITLLFYLLSTTGYISYLFIQKDYLHHVGYGLLIVGFLCHSTAVCIGFIQSGHIPVSNLYETLLIAGWAVACAYIVLYYKIRLKILGTYATLLLLLIIGVSSFLPKESVQVQNIFNSIWLFFHIVTIFFGEAILALACGAGILYLIQERTIKNKRPGFFFRRLPSLELLDITGHTCIITGFIMLTMGLITGMVYAKSVWGKFWSWDPKEIWSAISWLVYAALLHQRIAVGLRGRKAAIMAIIGFCILLFTFFGVNFLLQGHHGEFTRW